MNGVVIEDNRVARVFLHNVSQYLTSVTAASLFLIGRKNGRLRLVMISKFEVVDACSRKGSHIYVTLWRAKSRSSSLTVTLNVSK